LKVIKLSYDMGASGCDLAARRSVMNVLLTSVGRRSYLVEYFKDALGPKGKVIATNSESLTSGMIVSDKSYTVPRVDSEKYIPRLLEICHENDIGLVVSLFDIDLP